MHKKHILALGASAAVWCSLWLSQIATEPLWPILIFSAMYLGWSVQLTVNCKCDEHTQAVASRSL